LAEELFLWLIFIPHAYTPPLGGWGAGNKKGSPYMATLLNILKNKNGIALRLPVKPPPIIVYSFHYVYATNMEIFFQKASRMIFLHVS
jgi:hypothetical protein